MILTADQWYELIDTSIKLFAGVSVAALITWVVARNLRQHKLQAIDRNIGLALQKSKAERKHEAISQIQDKLIELQAEIDTSSSQVLSLSPSRRTVSRLDASKALSQMRRIENDLRYVLSRFRVLRIETLVTATANFSNSLHTFNNLVQEIVVKNSALNDKAVWGEAYRDLAMAQIALHKEIGLAIDSLYESRG